jgi:carbon catabolite-derepressing protein kinase
MNAIGGLSDDLDPINPSSLLNTMSPRSMSSVGTDRSSRPYVSKIGILPSSLPHYHKMYWEAYKSGKTLGDGLSTTHAEDTEPHPQTDAEKAETRSRLNPHSKGSQIKLAEAMKPAVMTQLPAKKNRPTKWQFGIRSRNQPLEAIGSIYRSLKALGAEWCMDEDEMEEMIPDTGFDDGYVFSV